LGDSSQQERAKLNAPRTIAKGIPAMPPISLSDAQMTALLHAAQPLDRDLREPFLLAVAKALQGREPLGDGEVFRTIREVQREFWHPPVSNSWPGKYSDTRRASR
jgi:hypothetical protein